MTLHFGNETSFSGTDRVGAVAVELARIAVALVDFNFAEGARPADRAVAPIAIDVCA